MSDLSYVGATTCWYCGEGNEVLIHTRMRPVFPSKIGVTSMRPCSKCEGYMKMGIILIVVTKASMDDEIKRTAHMSYDEDHPMDHVPNPSRTGLFTVMREEAVHRLVGDGKIWDSIAKARWTFIDDETAEATGIARAIRDNLKDKKEVE